MTKAEKLITDCFILMASFVLTEPTITKRQSAEISRLLKRMKPYIDRAARLKRKP